MRILPAITTPGAGVDDAATGTGAGVGGSGERDARSVESAGGGRSGADRTEADRTEAERAGADHTVGIARAEGRSEADHGDRTAYSAPADGPDRFHFRRSWGAEPEGEALWRFSLWAPEAKQVEVALPDGKLALVCESGGWHRGIAAAETGAPYMFVVDGSAIPDPAARAQTGDVHAPSRLVDPGAYAWTSRWAGRPWEEAVIYELHLGTFTREGTFAAAAAQLGKLAALGITAIEIMPVAQFAGRCGWGYDGVLPYAPHPAYGTPEEMKAFVEAAQALGLMVILDVVYNHFGPDGAYLQTAAPAFFDESRVTPWGPAIDYREAPVRAFFIENALAWITEYRLDGLRLDAIHQIRDSSDPELVVEIARRIRAMPLGRPVHLIVEDERNIARLHEPGSGLYDGKWNDDYHHALHCLLTGEDEGYYGSFAVDPMADLLKSLAEGQVEQGQPREGSEALRGAPSGHLPWTSFINFNQNHDQIGNRAHGERLAALAPKEALQVLHAMLLLSPFTPMLFMGEEAGSVAPFLFFADFEGDLADAVRHGRAEEFRAFTAFGTGIPDALAPGTRDASRPFEGLDPARAAEWRTLTAALLSLRETKVVPLLKSGRAGPARVTRTGLRSFVAEWPFAAGTIEIRANIGAPPGSGAYAAVAPARALETDNESGAPAAAFTLGDIETSPFAFAFRTRSGS